MDQNRKEKILVTGAGGFIGHHLVRYLKNKGYWVRGVDIKYPEFSPRDEADEFLLLDLRDFRNAMEAVKGIDKVYTLAANMGGIGFITSVKADVMRDNVLINVNMAEASRLAGIKRLFFSSSACVYPTFKQESPEVTALKESDAYPADPDNEYGWEKLYSERVYQAYHNDYGLDVRIARYHNIYGPEGTYEGGREKAPAALCRKIALAKDDDAIEVWGDGKQTRSFCYIDDCLEGTYRLMESDFRDPLNIGSDRLVTIDELIDIISSVAGKKIKKAYQQDKPQGVRGRNSDNALCKKILNWEPQISLEEGLRKTYQWIEKELRKQKRI
ncbi:MAG: NAD-dependent epimerase/dehydratase family protein [Candidatus Aminicenantes bacterium]|nr:NAD-dependent epimerase/dehydratase family protein [Candidatus Aminicenantes bacterium]